MNRNTRIFLMLLLIVSIIVFLVLNLLLGTARIPAGDVIDILFGPKATIGYGLILS